MMLWGMITVRRPSRSNWPMVLLGVSRPSKKSRKSRPWMKLGSRVDSALRERWRDAPPPRQADQ
eukprot:289882-Alexandrium_andersonii.AAC.1